MLRRFETYGFAPHATPELRDELARVLRRTGLYVPEVLDSAVGRNRSAAGVDLVWEHAYEHPASYAHYMCHPFHICVLDRYLLPENPECITASRRELRLGLLGYEIDGAPFRVDGGVRRIVAMRTATDAAPDAVAALLAEMNARVGAVPEVLASVAAENTMGLEWFPDGWTHVWEQAFADEAAMQRVAEHDAALLAASPMGEWVDVWYEIDAEPAGADPDVDLAPPPPGPVYMVDAVDVAPSDADRYVDAFERLYLPGARQRGMSLAACWHSPRTIGEDVTVFVVFDVGTWAEWEQARNAAVVDPAMPEWLAARREMMRRGTRRFCNAASFSPPR
ncbi:MAG: NIPSNAP family protein [Acidimicrobiia bacterium]|jgi:hypothetical protein